MNKNTHIQVLFILVIFSYMGTTLMLFIEPIIFSTEWEIFYNLIIKHWSHDLKNKINIYILGYDHTEEMVHLYRLTI